MLRSAIGFKEREEKLLEDQMIYESNYQLPPDPQFETDHDYDSDQQVMRFENNA